MICLKRRRADPCNRPSFVDHNVRRARLIGAPRRAKNPASAEEIPKTGGRGKPLPYGMAGKRSSAADGRPLRAAPYGDFRTFHSVRRYRIGFMAAAAIVSPMTEMPVGAGP